MAVQVAMLVGSLRKGSLTRKITKALIALAPRAIASAWLSDPIYPRARRAWWGSGHAIIIANGIDQRARIWPLG
jgi:hypothetical protein